MIKVFAVQRVVGVLLVLGVLGSTSGCATVRTLDAAKVDAPVIYAGTRLDLYAMQGGCCAVDKFGAEAPKYPALDLPGSALLDTLLLPLSLATELGIGLSVSGGL
jgi:uncharacterized protein YceK